MTNASTSLMSLILISLSTLDRETESSIRAPDNGDDWWRSDQDLDNIDTIIVFSKFTTQIKRDSRFVALWPLDDAV